MNRTTQPRCCTAAVEAGPVRCARAAASLLMYLLPAVVLAGCAASSDVPISSKEPVGSVPLLAVNETALARQVGAPAPRLSRPDWLPDFDEPDSVLRYVLSSLPERVVVYPTERYYYFQFPLGPRLISGNIRFSDIELGELSIGYFDAMNNRDMRTKQYAASDTDPTVDIAFLSDEHTVSVGFGEIRRRFYLDQRALRSPAPPLLGGETYVSGIRDESGYFLHLLYWEPGECFYYVLNETEPLPEELQPLAVETDSGPAKLWYGTGSRFVFFEHTPSGRRVLVGVHARNIQLNTRYDGPFDQVPPRLNIRPELESAYPYVLAAGGIDDHGNFLERKGQRVAISPYVPYTSGVQLERTLAGLLLDSPTPTAWAGAVYEPKKDWTPPAARLVHSMERSAAWPANHMGSMSGAWPDAHRKELSLSWPANHEARISRVSGSVP